MGEIVESKDFDVEEDGTIVRDKQCPKCGKKLHSKGEFCEYCGARIGKVEQGPRSKRRILAKHIAILIAIIVAIIAIVVAIVMAIRCPSGPAPSNEISGLYPIKSIDGKAGYINETGTIVIHPHYDNCEPFSEDFAVVQINDKWGYINRTGKLVIEPQYDSAYDFNGGLAHVILGDKCGFIDTSGKMVIPPIYDWTSSFKDRKLATVKINNKYGFIDKTGKMVLSPQYDYTCGFHEDLAATVIDYKSRKYGYLDTNGNITITVHDYANWGNFYEGLAMVAEYNYRYYYGYEKKYGYIDTEGRTAIRFQYEDAGNFSEGLVCVKLDGKWGFINKNGKMIIPPQYDAVGMQYGRNDCSFSGGIAIVQLGSYVGIIDTLGTPINFFKCSRNAKYKIVDKLVLIEWSDDNSAVSNHLYANRSGDVVYQWTEVKTIKAPQQNKERYSNMQNRATKASRQSRQTNERNSNMNNESDF